MSFAFKPAPPRSFTRSNQTTPRPPPSNSPAAPWAFSPPPPPPIPATPAASKSPAPKAPSSSNMTASSSPISETPQPPPPNPAPSTKTKAPPPPSLAISGATNSFSKIFSRPSNTTAPPPATASKAAAASPSSKPSTAPQKLPIVSPPSERKDALQFGSCYFTNPANHLAPAQILSLSCSEISVSYVLHPSRTDQGTLTSQIATSGPRRRESLLADNPRVIRHRGVMQ